MKTRYVVLILVGSLLALQLLALGLYLLIKTENDIYRVEMIIDIGKGEGTNITDDHYNVTIPLPVTREDGENVVETLERVAVVQGRCNLTLLSGPRLSIVSDTRVILRFLDRYIGEDLSWSSQSCMFQGKSGDLSSDSASIEIESDSDGVDIDLHLYQVLEYSTGSENGEFVACSTDLDTGKARYPLISIDKDDRYEIGR